MTEKKTFKNPELDYNTDAWHSNEWGWSVDNEVFPEKDWDMEVTFTKKVKPVEAGQRRTYKAGSLSEELVTVIAVSGDLVWVATDPDSLYDSSWVTKLEWIS
jgi:hypothetical protein